MSVTSPVDPALALQEATSSDLARRKMDMDALRKRLGDSSTKQEKLRESCEGFEAIFLQKMWEQMRKTVPKEGYLHSKDEEMYQSLFDIELCKKMAGAGGIGLADMLYTQLSQQLENTGRTTTPGRYRNPLNVPPSDNLSPHQPASPAAPAPVADNKKLTAAELYSPLPQEDAEPGDAGQAPVAEAPVAGALEGALKDLKTELGLPKEDEKGAAAAQWATTRAVMTGTEASGSPEAAAQPAGQPSAADPFAARDGSPAARADGPTPPMPDAARMAAGQPQAGPAFADRIGVEQAGIESAAQAGTASKKVDPSLLSWQGNGPVSIKERPSSAFGRNRKQVKNNDGKKEGEGAARGMAPQESLWPLEGQVTSRFGWEDDATGKRRWNAGITIAAPAGSPVRAVLAGRVVYAGPREGYGNTVVLEHKEGFRTYYSNLQSTTLKVGDKIKHGADFAKIATQPSPSPDGENSAFLHFEMKKGEMALNPESAIRRMATASR